MTEGLLTLTSDIVAAHVSHNHVGTADLPELIRSTYEALRKIGEPPLVEAPAQPAVAVRSSVKPDYLVCLEDGKKLTMLKRYLRTNFGMSPADYRAKWGLPADYPMVAPNYAAKRRTLAHSIGLGRRNKKDTATAAAGSVAAATKAGRRKLGIATAKPATAAQPETEIAKPAAKPRKVSKPRAKA